MTVHEPDLFTTGIEWPAPSQPSATSEAAADAITTPTGKARREAKLVRLLQLIASRESGYTIDELDAETQLGTGTICPRIDELRLAGFIDTSETVTRPTRRKREAAVHFATIKGRAACRLYQEGTP